MLGAEQVVKKDPIRVALYLLPGPKRTADRLVRAEDVTLYPYRMGKEGLSVELLAACGMQGVHVGVICQWKDSRLEVFRHVVPVYFSGEWTSLAAAGESMGCVVEQAEEIGEEEPIGRSVLTNVMCMSDGTVYECKRFGARQLMRARQWPVRFEGPLI